MFADAFDVFRAEPDAESLLLMDRDPDEAYVSVVRVNGATVQRQRGVVRDDASVGTVEQYAVYFPDGGAAGLDLSDAPGDFSLRWLDVERSRWLQARPVRGGSVLPLEPPWSGQWAAVLEVE